MAWSYVFTTIFVSGFTLNTIQLVSLKREKKMKEPFKMTIFSLALADLLSSSALIVLAVIFMITGKYRSGVLKFIFPSITSSQLHIVIITIQRLVAVIFPLKVKIVITSFRCAAALIFVWILSLSIAIVAEMSGGYTGSSILAWVTLINGAIVMFSYSFIIYSIIRRRLKTLPNSQSAQNLRTVFYSLSITIAFIVCNYPWVVMIIIKRSYDAEKIPLNIETLLLWLNLIIDPLIYFLFNAVQKNNPCCRHTT